MTNTTTNPPHEPDRTIHQPTRACGHDGGELRWTDPQSIAAWQTGHGSRQGRFNHLATCQTCGRTHAYRNLHGYGPNEWVMDDGSGYLRLLEHNAPY